MALDPMHAFYCRKDYLTLAQACKIKSGGVCERCGGIFDINELRPHHKIELTLDNIDDPRVTLNPDNIEVLCHNCHNAAHRRFGNVVGTKHVYLIHGSPCSGKTTYVENVATRNDVIVDLDKIHRSICICGLYDKPDATKQIAFDIRNLLLDKIYHAGPHRKWQDAYVIGTFPNVYDRERFIEQYNAEPIHIATQREECIRRAHEDLRRRAVLDMVLGWIDNYWKSYSER